MRNFTKHENGVLSTIFRRRAELGPDCDFLRAGETRLTYAQACRYAQGLRARGINAATWDARLAGFRVER